MNMRDISRFLFINVHGLFRVCDKIDFVTSQGLYDQLVPIGRLLYSTSNVRFEPTPA